MIDVTLNPATDLVLDRFVEVPPALVWKCWTEPEHLMPWFCPVPWKTTACTVDLRPGGGFFSRMEGPDGESHENLGCYLEVVPQRRLSWTTALGPDFRPHPGSPIPFTAVITLEPKGTGTRYLVQALHPTPEGAKAHADMGFAEGWGKALDQLVAYAAKLS